METERKSGEQHPLQQRPEQVSDDVPLIIFLFMTPTVALVNYMYITGASCLKKMTFLEEKTPQIYIYIYIRNRIFLHTCIVVLNVFQYM